MPNFIHQPRQNTQQLERSSPPFPVHCLLSPVTCRLFLVLLLLLRAAPVSGQDGSVVHVERDVPGPMRDGVVLRADVYRPTDAGSFPVLVERTPYGKQGLHPEALAKAGYIVVCQDARGRYASEGEFESFYRDQTHDAEDDYDTVEWAARLPGSTGQVGTFGAPYTAFP